MKSEKISQFKTQRFGTESDVQTLTGIAKRTLQKHRLFGKGFPFYRVGGRVFYDLDEVEATIRSGRVDVGGESAGTPPRIKATS